MVCAETIGKIQSLLCPICSKYTQYIILAARKTLCIFTIYGKYQRLSTNYCDTFHVVHK